MAGAEYRIYRLDAEAQEWFDMGVAVDERSTSRSDVLWDEAAQKLYILSHYKTENPSLERSDPESWARLYRYSYDAAAQSYRLDADHFPVAGVHRFRTETTVLDKDSTGRLWATWIGRTGDGDYPVYASYSTDNEWSWSEPIALPFDPEALVHLDDISALIAFSDDEGSKVGVTWGNQNEDRFYFATHRDANDPEVGWTLDANFLAAVSAPADGHVNMAVTAAGELFMVVKTDVDPNTQPEETLIGLITRERNGAATFIDLAPGSSRDTRPIVVINESTSELYVFTVNKSGGEAICIFPAAITSPLSNINFSAENCSSPEGEPPGSPTALAGLVNAQVFIGDGSAYLLTNNPTSTKQRVTNRSGVPAPASDESTNFHVLNLEGHTTAPDVTPTSPAGPRPQAQWEPRRRRRRLQVSRTQN